MKHQRTIIISLAAIGALGAVSLSRPGKSAISKVLPTAGPAKARSAAATPTPTLTPSPDIEQRARAAHGWTASIHDSLLTGSINFYDRAGNVTRQGPIKILRSYPDKVRVEITSGGATEILGFDHVAPWDSLTSSLTSPQQRDIRAWTRFTPERLFVTRSAGQQYAETRPIQEDHVPASPGRPALDLAEPIVFNRPLIADQTGNPLAAVNPGDQRNVMYLVNAADNIVNAGQWLEQSDPAGSLIGPNADLQQVRVDFSAWQRINGVLWPFEITHWLGGKVDFRVEVTNVLMNQNPASSLFQGP
jgi:hypothetical protein